MEQYKVITIDKDQVVPVAEKMKKAGNFLVMIHGFINKEGEQVLIDNQQEIRYIGLCYKHWKEGISHAPVSK